jgi:DNA polymerase-3 subunit epsilon
MKQLSIPNSNSIKKVFFDLETTGLNKDICGIYQFSGAIEVDGEIKEYFDFKMKPPINKVMEEGAIKLAAERGITTEVINSYPDSKIVFKQIIDLLSKYVGKYDKQDKFFLVGYNNRSFDDGFLRKYWEDMGDKFFGSFFWQNTIDVMVLASNYLLNCRKNMTNFKLSTVADFLCLEVDHSKLHDAEYDINLTYLVYQIVTSDVKCGDFVTRMEDSRYIYDYWSNMWYDIQYYRIPNTKSVVERVNEIVNKPKKSQDLITQLPF